MMKRSFSTGLAAFILAAVSFVRATPPEGTTENPPRGIVAALRYPGITVDPEDNISVDLIVKNTGRTEETVLLEVTEKPPGWKALLKGYGDVVSGVFVAQDEERTLTFSAEPEDEALKKLPPGTFHFAIGAQTLDGAITKSSSLSVTVVEEESAPEEITITTSYPVLRGPSDTKFEFSLDVSNESDEDTVFNFSATPPEDWEVSFKPAYEQKQISSLQIKANENKTVEVEVDPAYNAKAGEYPLAVRVQSPKAKAEVDLSVVLTGTYKIQAATINGLLSLSTQIGKTANLSLFVRNDGSAPQGEITFLSFKPENWEVKLEPEKIPGLAPGDMKQVEVTISPSEEALVGDYSVAINVEGEKSSDDVELRITVNASSTWGWIGVGIIVVVIAGLAVTFRVLGRR